MKFTPRPSILNGALALALGIATQLFANDPAPTAVTPDAALKSLIEGNARFASGRVEHPHQSLARRAEVATGQKPFAVIVGCADSRTSPEVVFDEGLGDVFVTRLAGSIVDDAALGSIEYAVEHLGASLIVVLGHESCGAVTAAMKGGELPGKIGAFVAPILPAVDAVKKTANPTVDAAIEENVRRTAAALADRSTILDQHIKAGQLKVVAACYNLHTGLVNLVPEKAGALVTSSR
jgi:carbonic anhydrase